MFLLFRVLFNARYYYPIYALLFLDFGLEIEHFLWLNMIWAIGIVILEVPSGALADTLGRRKLLVAGGFFMIVEIALFAFAPTGNVPLLFGLLVVNRILSGAAEALVSGADEALAYDTLKNAGMEKSWDRVLARLMQIQSLAFVVALAVGGVVYDERFLNAMASAIGFEWGLDREDTMRIPLYLTLINAIFVLIAALRMKEPLTSTETRETVGGQSFFEGSDKHLNTMTQGPTEDSFWSETRRSFSLILKAGKWIFQTPFALAVICGGFLVDSFLRTFVTFNSQYYQIIQLPEASYGIIGGALSGFGVIWPSIAQKMSQRFGPMTNYLIVCGLTVLGLTGACLFVPYVGVIWVVVMMVGWAFLNYFLSTYLNRVTPSEQRATVLSFRGLSFNLAYFTISLLVNLRLDQVEPAVLAAQPGIGDRALENAKFVAVMPSLPIAFLISVVIFLVFTKFTVSPKDVPPPQTEHA